jgi:release factor glutamine methyltransferase
VTAPSRVLGARQSDRRADAGSLLLAGGIERLREAGLPTARHDAEWLLATVLGVPRFALYTDRRPISSEEADRFHGLITRRAAHEPVQYLVGFEEFRELRLRVTPEVLVPRPETEALVEWALEVIGAESRPRAADIGTGCGAVACALAAGHPGVEVAAVDCSPSALAVAAENVARLGLGARIRLLAGDGLEPVFSNEAPIDLVVANPPYLPSAVIPSLPLEVSRYEPRVALDGGPDGMAVSRRIIFAAGRALRPGGWLLLEIGDEQAGPLGSLLAAEGFTRIEARRDLTGVERCLGGQWPGQNESGLSTVAPIVGGVHRARTC